MIIKCYLIDDTPKNRVRLDLLEKAIPCFAEREPSTTYPNTIAYTIQCRQEDVATVERHLAEII